MAARRCPAWSIVHPCNSNRKSLTRGLQGADLRMAEDSKSAERAAFRATCRRFDVRDGRVDQLRTVMQEMSERFNVRHTASA